MRGLMRAGRVTHDDCIATGASSSPIVRSIEPSHLFTVNKPLLLYYGVESSVWSFVRVSVSGALFSLPKKQKVFKIFRHIESCGTCMKH